MAEDMEIPVQTAALLMKEEKLQEAWASITPSVNDPFWAFLLRQCDSPGQEEACIHWTENGDGSFHVTNELQLRERWRDYTGANELISHDYLLLLMRSFKHHLIKFFFFLYIFYVYIIRCYIFSGSKLTVVS